MPIQSKTCSLNGHSQKIPKYVYEFMKTEAEIPINVMTLPIFYNYNKSKTESKE
jgi:hypothetical protein